MFFKNKTPNKLIIGLIALVSLSLVFINFQSSLLSVSATVIPVEVSIKHLDFGLTFPGENLQGSFTVSYAEQGNGIDYWIIQRRKPLPPDHPEYPNGGDPARPGYYRNLCPYLTKVSLEGEGDTEASSFVGPNDLSDKWLVYYSVPAIMGKAAQDHKGGVVTANGEYGCDITINVEEFCGDGIKNRNEECDDGNDNNNDDCRNNCTLPSICDNDLDVAMVMDRSGSMGYASRCDWWQLKCVNPPTCSSGYSWVKNTTYNQTSAWCAAKNQSAPHNSVWTEFNPVKLPAVKQIANSFLDNMGTADQSSLVSFANNATLDKQLSNDHAATKAAVSGLTAYGATDIGDAIKLATDELTSLRVDPAADQVMVLLTDGMANKPYGPGYGEWPADAAYALTRADEAASAGIKIFTIGLDGDINETMLKQIASTTGAKYYFSPTAEELNNIFELLQSDICGEVPVCGDGKKNGSEECDGTDGVAEHQTCSQTCALIDLTYCGDNIKQSPNQTGAGGPLNNGYEACDGEDGVGPNQSCTASCTLTDLPYCGDGLVNQASEQCDDGNQADTDECKSDCTLAACKADMDVMMVLDRSGSMGYSSICNWWQLKCINPPSCSSGYAWVKNTTYNQTNAWCNAKNQAAPYQSVYEAIDPVKIIAAKQAANNFLSLMGTFDQSGLVSYSNDATLDKGLNNNHGLTQTAVNNLVTYGATDIGDAIKLGFNELMSYLANPLANKVIILLTDGLANKPYGPGYGEYPADVTYALNQASLAAAAGIKIYTIGLGNFGDINETMLNQIAADSGGQYYHAPTAAELEQIFGQIADTACP